MKFITIAVKVSYFECNPEKKWRELIISDSRSSRSIWLDDSQKFDSFEDTFCFISDNINTKIKDILTMAFLLKDGILYENEVIDRDRFEKLYNQYFRKFPN